MSDEPNDSSVSKMNDAVAAVGEFSAGKALAKMGERPRSRCDLFGRRKRREVRGGECPYALCPELEETRRGARAPCPPFAAFCREPRSVFT